MEARELLQLTSELIDKGEFKKAEDVLLRARAGAIADHDLEMADVAISELAEMYSIMDPPNLSKAEELSLERERLRPSAKTKLQTAMLLYWSRHDPARALRKLNEAIEEGKREGASGIVYSSLALSGVALLDLGQFDGAALVLEEIEQMVLQRKSFVPGDETYFLERALSTGLDASRVRSIASSLIPICRDPVYVKRLKELATTPK